jgi:hypothetical protein
MVGVKMALVLGILAILQIVALPGLVIYKLINLRGNLIDKILVIFGLSLIFNYCLIFLLAAVGIYARSVFTIFVLVELTALLWLYRNDLRMSFDKFVTATRDNLNDMIDFFIPKRRDHDAVTLLYFAWLALIFLLAARSLVWAANLLFDNMGTVFSAWDAVVSWNRWATEWAAGQIPTDSHFYPQLIPANWSITYLLQGDTTLQFFAKSIMPLFGLLMFVGLMNLGIATAESHFFIAMALLMPLLKNFLRDGVSNGYVDIAVAFMGLMAIYFLIKSQKALEIEERYRSLLLGAVFAAGAAVTKQPGVYIALCYPILAWLMVRSSAVSLWNEKARDFIARFGLIYLIWVSWYVLKGVQVLTGADRPHLEVLINLSANTYGNVSLLQQIMAALARFDKFLIFFVLIILALPFMDRFYRALTLLMLPYPILWAWFAGYDTRNLAIFLPMFALLSGYSVNIFIDKVFEIIRKTSLLKIPLYVPIAFVCIILVSLSFFISPRLHDRQVFLQKQNFSAKTNEVLYELIAAENSQTKILTNYPMEFLPGLKNYQVRFDFQDENIFLGHLDNQEIEYLLYSNSVTPEIREYIDSKVNDGSYEVVLVNTQWRKFTLVKILNR